LVYFAELVESLLAVFTHEMEDVEVRDAEERLD
jgi:hypothetical protein